MPTTRTNDIDTYYVTRGAGPPIVFVHGMLMTTRMWDHQRDALSDRFRTIAYDVRGHGHTGASTQPQYSIEGFAADLDALLEALAIDRAVICGLSMGGAIAQAFAAAHPEKVAGLVLADTFPPGPLPLTGRIAMANIRFLARLDRVIDYRTLNRWQLAIGNRLLPGIAGDPATIQRILEDAPTIAHEEFVKIADATAGFQHLDLDLSVVTAPTLILHGEHLPTANDTATRRLVAALSNAPTTVDVVPDSGHASNIDNPAYFSAALRRFLLEDVHPDLADTTA
ncbi:MAG: alpha/beta fold hydrolase [Halodesulfurarchaeum sp.]